MHASEVRDPRATPPATVAQRCMSLGSTVCRCIGASCSAQWHDFYIWDMAMRAEECALGTARRPIQSHEYLWKPRTAADDEA